MPSSRPDRIARAEGPALDLTTMLLPADYPSLFAQTRPDRLALVFGTQSCSYSELDRMCNAVVAVLRGLGLSAGHRVAYLGRNSDLFFAVLFAVFRASFVLVPINWRNTVTETRFALDDSGASLIIADEDFIPIVVDADTLGRTLIIADDPGPTGLRARVDAAMPATRDPADPKAPGLQLYTSGTTGKPKAVLISQHALGAQRHAELASAAFADWGTDEILLSALPSFHIGGMSWVLTGLVRGQTVILTNNTAPSSLLEQCIAHGVTRTFIVPTLVRGLIEEMERRDVRAPTLRGIHYGAASMSPPLLERSMKALQCRFLQYYGMTEATGSITMLGPQDHDLARPRLLRSVGQPQSGFIIEIRDPDKQPVNVDVAGEIWVMAPSLFSGYWNRPEATAEALESGWYRSGDGGMLDANGFLFLTDRIKDMIVSGGENVYPAEVEAVLREHPAVQDCAVFGLPHPKWGEGVSAAVELRAGQGLDADTLVAFARQHLAAYKIPRRIEFGVTLPRTAAGKVQRGALRQRLIQEDESST